MLSKINTVFSRYQIATFNQTNLCFIEISAVQTGSRSIDLKEMCEINETMPVVMLYNVRGLPRLELPNLKFVFWLHIHNAF